ncbi:glycosyltransferase family 4 protein [Candidatus Hydrogenedentota bacterium]
MRILFFSHYFPPEGNAPASRTYENCKRWVRAGHQVTVITCAPNVPNGVVYEGHRNRLHQREVIDGVEVIRVWTYIAANKGIFRRILNYVSYMFSAIFFGLFVKRPDVIIATSPQFFCGWAGVLVGKLRRLPFILEIRDIWPESIQAVGVMRRGMLVRILEWMELKMYASALHIVTVGEGYRRRLLEKNVPDEKISVVMNGVDRELFKPQDKDAALIEKYGLQGKFVCSYIGTIGMACALDVTLRAARMLKQRDRNDIVFLLVGDGAVRAELQTEARRLELDNVIFVGRQDKSMMPSFLSITDVCLVHLRKTDLFSSVMPSKIFEAGGMARPVIMGVQGYAAEIVEAAQMGLHMEPESEDDLAGALERLAGDSLLVETLGRAGHDYIVERFDRDKLAKDYLRCIKTMTGPKRA